MKVYLLIGEDGDGTSFISYFKNEELAIKATKKDEFHPSCGSYGTIEVVEGWEPEYGFDDKFLE